MRNSFRCALMVLATCSSACQLLPEGEHLLPQLPAAQLATASPPEPAATGAPRLNPTDYYTPVAQTETAAAAPVAQTETASAAPVVVLIIPPQPTPRPTPEPTPAQPLRRFSLHFDAAAAGLVTAYPLRVSLEDADGQILASRDASAAELDQGLEMNTDRLGAEAGYRLRLNGQTLDGDCLRSQGFLMAGTTATAAAAEDFVAQPPGQDCRDVLTVRGRVVDQAGRGLAGVQLEAVAYRLEAGREQPDRPIYRQLTRSDRDGNYLLTAFPSGKTVHLNGSQGGYASSERSLSFELTLTDGARQRFAGDLILLEE